MSPFKFDVSLRLRHPTMNPEHICAELRLKAKHKWKVGDNRKTPKGQSLKGTYETTYCLFDLQHSKKIGLADFLRKYNLKLYRHKEFLNSIRSTGGSLEYFVGWYSDQDSGEIFDLKLLNQLVELGMDLSIAFYK
jgi:hypothetical protein